MSIHFIGAIGSMVPTWWKLDQADEYKTCIFVSISGSLAFLSLVGNVLLWTLYVCVYVCIVVCTRDCEGCQDSPRKLLPTVTVVFIP